MRNQASIWADALWTGKEPMVSDLAKIVFGLSSLANRLAKLCNDKDKEDFDIYTERETCLTLLTLSILQNGLKSLENLEANPLVLVSGIHKVLFCGCYLPLLIVGVLIYVKKYPILARVYPGLTPVIGMFRVTLERCLSSWTSANQKGILTCKDNITFDCFSESWNVFHIETTGILITYSLLQLVSLVSVRGSGVTPSHL